MKKSPSGYTTKTLHTRPNYGQAEPVAPAITMSTNFVTPSLGEFPNFAYSRSQNPNREQLERIISELEGGGKSLVFASGMAAIDAIFQASMECGIILSTKTIYGGTLRLLNDYHRQQPEKIFFTNFHEVEIVELFLKNHPNTTIFLESVTNPLLEVFDLSAIISLAKKYNAKVVVDNTFLTPIGCQPLAMGAHTVIHSSSKYLGGHSDLIQGCLTTLDDSFFSRLKFIQNAKGAVPSPFDCWLMVRSLATLELRIERHVSNSQKVVQVLEGHPKVKKVYHPSLQKNMSDAFKGTAVISVEFHSVEQMEKFIAQLSYFTLSESLGGVESLINYPWKMTHGHLPETERRATGISPELIRLSVGIENPNDLLNDIKQSLELL